MISTHPATSTSKIKNYKQVKHVKDHQFTKWIIFTLVTITGWLIGYYKVPTTYSYIDLSEEYDHKVKATFYKIKPPKYINAYYSSKPFNKIKIIDKGKNRILQFYLNKELVNTKII